MSDIANKSGDGGEDRQVEISDSQISKDLLDNTSERLADLFGGDDQGGGDDVAADPKPSRSDRNFRPRKDKAGAGAASRKRLQAQGFDEEEEDEEEIDNGDQEGRSREAANQDQAGSGDDDEVDDDVVDDAAPTPPRKPAPTPASNKGIPDNLIAAARRLGRTDEEIQALIKADPQVARATFERDQRASNELSARYAQIGRQAIQGQPPQGQPPAQQWQQPFQPVHQHQQQWNQQQPPQQPINNGGPYQGSGPNQQQQQPQPFRFSQELYDGVEPTFAEHGLKPIEETINRMQQGYEQQIQALSSHVQEAVGYIRQQQRESTIARMDQFFNARKGYDDFYGVGQAWRQLTPQQAGARDRVIQTADAIRAGAQLQGEEIGEEQALSMAHDLVTANMQQKAARRQIKDQLTTRSRQSTIRPTHRNGASRNSSRDPLDNAVSNAQTRLRNVFSGR